MKYFNNISLLIVSWLFIVATPVAFAEDKVTVPYTIEGVSGNTGDTLTFEFDEKKVNQGGVQSKKIVIPINKLDVNADTEVSVEFGTPSADVTLQEDNKKATVTLKSNNKADTTPANTTDPRLEVDEDPIESGSNFTITPKGFSSGKKYTWTEKCDGGLTFSASKLPVTGIGSGNADPRQYSAPYNRTDSDQDCTITLTAEPNQSTMGAIFSALNVFKSEDDKDKKETAKVTVTIKAVPKPKLIATESLDDAGKKLYELELTDYIDGSFEYVWSQVCEGGLKEGEFSEKGQYTGSGKNKWYPPENNTTSEHNCTLKVDANLAVPSVPGEASAPSQSASVKIIVESPFQPSVGLEDKTITKKENDDVLNVSGALYDFPLILEGFPRGKPTTITYDIKGEGLEGTFGDSNLTGRKLTIPEDGSYAEISISVIDNDIAEGDKTFEIVITEVSDGVRLKTGGVAKGIIVDDDSKNCETTAGSGDSLICTSCTDGFDLSDGQCIEANNPPIYANKTPPLYGNVNTPITGSLWKEDTFSDPDGDKITITVNTDALPKDLIPEIFGLKTQEAGLFNIKVTASDGKDDGNLTVEVPLTICKENASYVNVGECECLEGYNTVDGQCLKPPAFEGLIISEKPASLDVVEGTSGSLDSPDVRSDLKFRIETKGKPTGLITITMKTEGSGSYKTDNADFSHIDKPGVTTTTIPATGGHKDILVPIVQDKDYEPTEAFKVAFTATMVDANGKTVNVNIEGETEATFIGTISNDDVANKPPVVKGKIEDQIYTLPRGTTRIIEIDANIFSDPDGDSLQYSLSEELPVGLRADFSKPAPGIPVQPRIEGDLSEANVGDHTITIIAKDGKGGEVSTSFKLTVNLAKLKAVTLDALDKVSSNQGVEITVRDLYSGYSISSTCEGLKDNGEFTFNYLDRNTWKAPVNETGEEQTCTIKVKHPDYSDEITKDIIVTSETTSKEAAASTPSKETTESKVVNKTVSVSQTVSEKEDSEGNRELTFTIELSCPDDYQVECSANTCAKSPADCNNLKKVEATMSMQIDGVKCEDDDPNCDNTEAMEAFKKSIQKATGVKKDSIRTTVGTPVQ